MPAEALRAQDRIKSSDADQAVRIMQDYGRDVEEMLKSEHLPPEWDEWVIVFQVPRDARPFALLMQNPARKDDQPRVVSVRVLR